jgi:hypothetical protein
MADAHDKPPPLHAEGIEGAEMCGHQVAGRPKERAPLRRQADHPGRPLKQSPAEPIFEPFDLQAHCGLGCVHRLGRAGETLQVGHHHESLDRLDIERAHRATI